MTPTPQQPTPPARSAAATPIMITTAIIGGFALLVTGTSAAVAAVGAQSAPGSVASGTALDTTGITGVEVDASAADLSIEFGDVSEATLEVTGPRADQWSLRRDQNELVVESPRGIFGFCFGWCPPDEQIVVLTLPTALSNGTVDLDATLGAGALRADGAFRDVDLELSAGRMNVAGSARSVDLEMGAGNFSADLSDVVEASLTVSAGSADVRLTGQAPRETDLEVSAGSLDLTLPDVPYQVHSEVSAGNLDNQLRTGSSARNLIEAEVSAGKIVLRPGR